jgi:tRNA pseudouridine38-40 synthase
MFQLFTPRFQPRAASMSFRILAQFVGVRNLLLSSQDPIPRQVAQRRGPLARPVGPAEDSTQFSSAGHGNTAPFHAGTDTIFCSPPRPVGAGFVPESSFRAILRPPMRNIRLTLAYDGTDFHGWALQPNHPTIQGTVVDVASKLTSERVFLLGAGRTDAGVHALAQTASFKTRSGLSPGEFLRAFNALLPPAIRVLRCEEESPEFQPRWNALAKTYQYRIYRGPIVPPFEHRYVLHYPFPLDEQAMRRAAALFEGTHDFTAFAASTEGEEEGKRKEPLREILRAETGRVARSNIWSRAFAAAGIVDPAPPAPGAGESNSLAGEAATGEELVFTVRGRSFLRFMVRKMTGTLLEIGRGRLAPEDIPRLFESRDRSAAGPTVPPQGLFLVEVEYPDQWSVRKGE